MIGKNGQLAWELVRSKPQGWHVTAVGREEFDITHRHSVASIFEQSRPDIIINSAAYTAVDRAEQATEEAYLLNEAAVAELASHAKNFGASFIQLSTDFVFDGKKSEPYDSMDAPSPLNVYGHSKLAGERALFASEVKSSVVIRTSWVYSCHGSNFVKTMLRLMAERDSLGVVSDQVGSPTWANGLAKAVWTVAGHMANSQVPSKPEIFHWADAGVASWYDFATAIQEIALDKGILQRPTEIRPISQKEYPTPAQRPSYSVLDKSKLEQTFNFPAKHWRTQLTLMLDEYKELSKRGAY
ncbi:dTDP-4-dehydrorhamnose reductase [Microbulbifer yueqingensis]|uniref:dTDP-4-dehydrorhamnose reductase n=1 Tax=Microbulbifer yueqingensis TaxID=658219 RepID=A0A1G9AA42_9GAMM|nr:dTDP-4-dehydrorhamnose reductase [Microbulbifer yueqingensis]SDK24121.1 dTDP-4-dehydrorhamnose reductase [Microbulbifer yueqingensis]